MLLWIIVIVGFAIVAKKLGEQEAFRKDAEYKINTTLSKARELEKQLTASREEVRTLRRRLKEIEETERDPKALIFSPGGLALAGEVCYTSLS